MGILSGLQKLIDIFSSAQAAVRNEGLCDFGQHEKTMRYSHTNLDRRAGHALAVFDIETLDGKNVQAQVTAPQLGQAIKSYPESQHPDPVPCAPCAKPPWSCRPRFPAA